MELKTKGKIIQIVKFEERKKYFSVEIPEGKVVDFINLEAIDKWYPFKGLLRFIGIVKGWDFNDICFPTGMWVERPHDLKLGDIIEIEMRGRRIDNSNVTGVTKQWTALTSH